MSDHELFTCKFILINILVINMFNCRVDSNTRVTTLLSVLLVRNLLQNSIEIMCRFKSCMIKIDNTEG